MGFGERVREAFGDAQIRDIAELLGVSYHAVRNYLAGRIPGPEILIQISNVTGCSIHWLLTGDGPKGVAGPLLPDNVLDAVKQEADLEGAPIDQMVAQLASEAAFDRRMLRRKIDHELKRRERREAETPPLEDSSKQSTPPPPGELSLREYRPEFTDDYKPAIKKAGSKRERARRKKQA